MADEKRVFWCNECQKAGNVILNPEMGELQQRAMQVTAHHNLSPNCNGEVHLLDLEDILKKQRLPDWLFQQAIALLQKP